MSELSSASRLRSVIVVNANGHAAKMMIIHEAAPARRAQALSALAANPVRGHLAVPTCLIAADEDGRAKGRRCINIQSPPPGGLGTVNAAQRERP